MKFKTTLSIPQTSIEHPSTNNNLEELAAVTAAANRRRRLTSSDYTTELSLYNSKSDSWALNLADEIIQTNSISGRSSLLNGACTDVQRHHQQRQHSYTQDDETADFLSTPKQHMSSNYLQHSPLKPTSSNLTITTENPWRKLSSVRYKLDEHNNADQRNQTQYQPVHAQHITFV